MKRLAAATVVVLAILAWHTAAGPTGETVPVPANSVYNVRDFGAVGDGQANDEVAFRTAIEAAEKAGGGIVLVVSAMVVPPFHRAR